MQRINVDLNNPAYRQQVGVTEPVVGHRTAACAGRSLPTQATVRPDRSGKRYRPARASEEGP